MPIEWRDAMSIEHDMIDNDHKRLIELINAYEKAIVDRKSEKLVGTFEQLIGYAKGHFMREEELLHKIGFIQENEHKHCHEVLMDHLQQFHDNLRQASGFDPDAVSLFLRNWLVNHVLNEDKKMVPYIRAAKKDPRTAGKI